MHCIAAGMNWSPTDKTSLITQNISDIKEIEKNFQKCINNLDERKKRYEKLVKTEKDLFAILKNIHE